MPAVMMPGGPVADAVFADLAPRIAKLIEGGHTPGLATVLIGDDEPSARYVGMKMQKAEELGCNSPHIHLPQDCTTDQAIDAVQLNYAIDNRAAETRLLPLAADRGAAALVNLPFGGGGLLKRLQGRPLPAWAGEIGCRTWAQVLLKYVISHPAVTCAIPGTSRPEHMRENAEAGMGVLPDAAMRRRMIAALE